MKPASTDDAELLGGADRGHHFLGGPLPHALRVAVAPDVIGQQGLVARVDRIAHRLADAMVAHDRHGQIVPGEQVELAGQ